MTKGIGRNLRNNATPQEIIIWSRLRKKQLGYKFRRQHSFERYVVDFYCKELMLVIEIDGWQHKKKFNGEKEDIRTKFLESKGLYILRFWNNDVNNNIEGVMQKIYDVCDELK
jgi:very-short-patch-repair endonuclease